MDSHHGYTAVSDCLIRLTTAGDIMFWEGFLELISCNIFGT